MQQDRTSNGALLRWMENIDKRLQSLTDKVDTMCQSTITIEECKRRHEEIATAIAEKANKSTVRTVIATLGVVLVGLSIVSVWLVIWASVGKGFGP